MPRVCNTELVEGITLASSSAMLKHARHLCLVSTRWDKSCSVKPSGIWLKPITHHTAIWDVDRAPEYPQTSAVSHSDQQHGIHNRIATRTSIPLRRQRRNVETVHGEFSNIMLTMKTRRPHDV